MNCSCQARAHTFNRETNMPVRVKIISKDHNHGRSQPGKLLRLWMFTQYIQPGKGGKFYRASSQKLYIWWKKAVDSFFFIHYCNIFAIRTISHHHSLIRSFAGWRASQQHEASYFLWTSPNFSLQHLVLPTETNSNSLCKKNKNTRNFRNTMRQTQKYIWLTYIWYNK